MSIVRLSPCKFVAFSLGIVLCLVIWIRHSDRPAEVSEENEDFQLKTEKSLEKAMTVDLPVAKDALATPEVPNAREEGVAKSAEMEEESRVDAFDSLTDEWSGGRKTSSPTIKDIADYVERFRRVPKNRQNECLQRALNLIPDKNVELIKGILFDEQQDVEVKRLVLNDIINRPDEVKTPILKELAKDKTHPCYSDVEWICEGTGEKPSQKGGL